MATVNALLDQATTLVAKAKRTKTDADYRSALLALSRLPAAKVTPESAEFVREHGAKVYLAVDAAIAAADASKASKAKLEGELVKVTSALKVDTAAAATRKLEAVLFTYRLVKVTGIFKARALAKAFNLSEGYVSRMVLAGEAMITTHTSSASVCQELMAAAKDRRGILQDALKAKDPTLASVRAAISAPVEARKLADQNRGTAETAPKDANTVGLRFAALLVTLTKTGSAIDDTDKAKGVDVVRQVETALAAYKAKLADKAKRAPRKVTTTRKASKATPKASGAKLPTPADVASVLDGVRAEVKPS